MSDIDRFRPEDRRGVETLYRRTHGADAADANRFRWDWQHRRNPHNATGQPGIWVAREGPTVVGHYQTLPVRVSLRGMEVAGAWGTGALIAPERDQQGLDEALVRAWDRNSGAVLVLGLPGQSRHVLDRLHWPDSHIVPALVKPLTRRAVRLPHLPTSFNRFISAVTHPVVQIVSRSRPLRAECEPIRRFDSSFTALWDRLAPKFDLAVRRDSPYLNWRYIEPPHVRYAGGGAEASGRGARVCGLPPQARAAGAGPRCWSISSSIRTTYPGSRRCCGGSIARHAPRIPTRCDVRSCTACFDACCAATATST
jgi:hypothetical protein